MLSDLVSFVRRVSKGFDPPAAQKSRAPLRFGVLGASRAAPDGIIRPAKCHPDVEVVAVAARSKAAAEAFAKKWRIPRSYGGNTGYQDLLDDPGVDAIYVGLPNGLHFEWTMKALAAGKHVLCEKPIANNEEEAQRMFDKAEDTGLILLEAWQPRFHPAIQRVKEIVREGTLGRINSMSGRLGVWGKLFFYEDDIRFDFRLGGGGLMDMGPYPISVMAYLTDSFPRVESAECVLRNGSDTIDKSIRAQLTFGNSIPAAITTDANLEGWGPFNLIPNLIQALIRIECEHGVVEIRNFVQPHVWHSITIIPRNGVPWVEKAYTFSEGKGPGEEWWSAYRFQLGAFVNQVRGRAPQAWRTAEESLGTMKTIDAIYSKAGLVRRPSSTSIGDQM